MTLLSGAIIGAMRFSPLPETLSKSAAIHEAPAKSENALSLGSDFYVDMADVEQSLLRMQEVPFYLRPANDAWNDEIRLLDHELTELESTSPITRY